MNTKQADAPEWEPTASIVLSGVTAVAGLFLLIGAGWLLTGPQQGGMEHLGEFVLLMAAMGGALVTTLVGMITAGVGLVRSNTRGVRAAQLYVTFTANLAECVLVFLLPAMMGRG